VKLEDFSARELQDEMYRRRQEYRLSTTTPCRHCGELIEDRGGDMPVPRWVHFYNGFTYCHPSTRAEP
jgi:hypothetical protein